MKELETLKNRGQDVFKKLRLMKKESYDTGKRNCMKDKDGRIHFDKSERGRICEC